MACASAVTAAGVGNGCNRRASSSREVTQHLHGVILHLVAISPQPIRDLGAISVLLPKARVSL